MRVIAAIACFGAIVVAATGTAHAHYGRLWYQTAANTAKNIEQKWPKSVETSRCVPIPVWLRDRYYAHSIVKLETRYWDHFLCGLYMTTSDRACVVIAHITGQNWNNFYLTSAPRVPEFRGTGCTPYEFRG